jgi:flagellin
MGFRVNTNIAAMSAHTNAQMTNRGLDNSLEKLSSGLRINKAADDASGMVIADSLRSQANSLGQAISNANDAVGVIQIADKAMDEQLKILDTIKTKAIQASSDTQSSGSREAIQKDVNRLLEELNNIAQTTSYNGQTLLSGNFENKEFQIGAYSNQTIKASINNTEAAAIGKVQTADQNIQLGNTANVNVTALTGSTTVSVGASLLGGIEGLAAGDVISFEGSNAQYSIDNVETSSGTITLTSPLEQDVLAGANFEVSSYKQEVVNVTLTLAVADAATSFGVGAGNTVNKLQGLAVGDVLTFSNSFGTTQDVTINQIGSSGAISFGGTTITSGGALSVASFTVKSSRTLDPNLTTQVNTAAGATTVSFSLAASNIDGLGKGDKIQFEGDAATYTVDYVNSLGNVELTSGLAQSISSGTSMTVVDTADDFAGVNFNSATASSLSMTTLQAEASGLAKGDILRFTSSTGNVQEALVTNVQSSLGTISFGQLSTGGTTVLATAITTGNKLEVIKSETLGDAMTVEDYAQFTVGTTKLDGVQMTDSSGVGRANTGLGRVAELINQITDSTGVKATATVESTGDRKVRGGSLDFDMKINGETIITAGESLLEGDTDGRLVDAINAKKDATGVSASIDNGVLKLETDGRAMALEGFSNVSGIADGVETGTLSVTKLTSGEIKLSSENFTNSSLTSTDDNAIGSLSTSKNQNLSDISSTVNADGSVGMMLSREGANAAMNITEKAISDLDSTRANLGSVQNELNVTINNISVTQVNVKAAESQIRDVDFAAESANFSRLNILAQSGSYAMSQANSMQQNVLRLLQ